MNILSTNFNSGLEYLPESLEWLYCEKERFGNKFKEEYNNYTKEHYGYFDYQVWRESHPELILNAKRVIELESLISNVSLVIESITNERKRLGLKFLLRSLNQNLMNS